MFKMKLEFDKNYGEAISEGKNSDLLRQWQLMKIEDLRNRTRPPVPLFLYRKMQMAGQLKGVSEKRERRS